MDIGKRVIVHRLLKVDGVENLYGVAMLQKGVAALNHDAAFRDCSVKIEERKVTTNLQLKIRCFHIITHQSLHLVLQSVTARFAEMNADDIGGVAHPHIECSCRSCLECLCSACVLVHAIPP